MNTITVISPGLLTIVQDLGREGFGLMGVSASGAADSVSLRVGNRLLGNPENAAALEMTLLGGEFQFSEATLVTFSGSGFAATIDGKAIANHEAVQVAAKQSVKFGPTKSGARCYLCVQGGIEVPDFLGSRSTHLLSKLGGYEGRALKKGDVLPVGKARRQGAALRISAPALARLAARKDIRVTEGPQWPQFLKPARKTFLEQKYIVTEDSNRMGLRLQGEQLELPHAGEMITEGVSLGAIQVTPLGQPIILFVEQQTTGGYPKIANVIAADLPSVGQLRPRDEIRFELVTWEAARAALILQERILASAELLEA